MGVRGVGGVEQNTVHWKITSSVANAAFTAEGGGTASPSTTSAASWRSRSSWRRRFGERPEAPSTRGGPTPQRGDALHAAIRQPSLELGQDGSALKSLPAFWLETCSNDDRVKARPRRFRDGVDTISGIFVVGGHKLCS